MPDNCMACVRSASAIQSLAESGQRLTGLRRDVLDAMHHFARPVGAYELFDHLKASGRASAPPAVYRVLDYLVERDLVHKLPSLSAYSACKAAPHKHTAGFLICRKCKNVDEITNLNLREMDVALETFEFSPEHYSVEVLGLCARCALN